MSMFDLIEPNKRLTFDKIFELIEIIPLRLYQQVVQQDDMITSTVTVN